MSSANYTNIAEKAYGKVVSGVDAKIGGGDLWITFDDGSRLHFTHYQDCCEEVFIEDIDIDLQDIVGDMLVSVEEAVKESEHDCQTWTFYKIQTGKTCATVRWFGESNGYYSEEVDWEYLEAGQRPHGASLYGF